MTGKVTDFQESVLYAHPCSRYIRKTFTLIKGLHIRYCIFFYESSSSAFIDFRKEMNRVAYRSVKQVAANKDKKKPKVADFICYIYIK
jgi:hypothetical protein